MKVTGEATLHSDIATVYAALIDPAVLVRTIPGCQRLAQVGPDAYTATVLAGVAAIKGTFDGDVRLTDQNPPHSFTLHASGAGAPGTVAAVARVALAPGEDGTTRLSYDADATIGGVIGGVGQRMISGVARRTADDFFAAVDRALTGQPGAEQVPPSPAAAPAGTVAAGELAAESSAAQPAARVWTAPPGDPVAAAARQRVRDLLVGAAVGALIALLGVLVGAIVAGW